MLMKLLSILYICSWFTSVFDDPIEFLIQQCTVVEMV